MTVATEIVFSRVVSLGASDCVDVKAAEIGSAKQNDVRERGKELVRVSIVVEYDFVDDKMSNGNQIRQSEPCKQKSLVLLIPWLVDPFEEADNEAEGCNKQRYTEINGGHCYLAVHSIVQWREGASRNQEIDACVIESVGDRVDL